MRPDLLALIHRWREVLAGAAVALVGAALAAATFGATRWAAAALAALGLAAAWAARRRLRFAGGGGPGMVEVDERRLSYWGPLSGGAVDLDAVVRLDHDPGPPARWCLTTDDGARLAVPVDAEGAEALLDLLAALPGLGTHALLAARARAAGPRLTLWRAPRPALDAARAPPEAPRRLH